MSDKFGDTVIEAIRRLQDRVDVNHNSTQKQLQDVSVTMVENTESLKLHMYRTELAEARLNIIESDIKPIKHRLAMASGILAGIGIIATAIGLVASAVQIIEHFIH